MRTSSTLPAKQKMNEPQRAGSFSVSLSSASHGDFVIMPSTTPSLVRRKTHDRAARRDVIASARDGIELVLIAEEMAVEGPHQNGA